MTEINLLPWREEKHEQDKKKFIIYLSLSLICAVFIVFLISYYATSLVDNQKQRNQHLKNEMTLLNVNIAEIKNLKALRQTLIARMDIIQNLQSTRILTVRLLDEIIGIIPDGVYLYQLSRLGDKVTILGYAEENTNISELMRSIQHHPLTQDPELTEIKKSTDQMQPDENEFKLSFILKTSKKISVPSFTGHKR